MRRVCRNVKRWHLVAERLHSLERSLTLILDPGATSASARWVCSAGAGRIFHRRAHQARVNLWPASRIDELMPWAWSAERADNKLAAWPASIIRRCPSFRIIASAPGSSNSRDMRDAMAAVHGTPIGALACP